MISKLSGVLSNRPLLYGIIAALVVVGLLLPPVSLLERVGITCSGTVLDANAPATSTPDGLTVALSDPAQALTVGLQSIDPAKFTAGEAGDDYIAARDTLPVNLQLRSPIYKIKSCNAGQDAASLAINLPNGAQTATDTFDLYGWDGKTWSWLGAFLCGISAVGLPAVSPASVIGTNTPATSLTAQRVVDQPAWRSYLENSQRQRATDRRARSRGPCVRATWKKSASPGSLPASRITPEKASATTVQPER